MFINALLFIYSMSEYLHYKKNVYTIGNGLKYNFSEKKAKDEFLCLFLESHTEQDIEKLCKDFDIDLKFFAKFRNEKRSIRYSLNPLVFTFTDYFTDAHTIKVYNLLIIVKPKVLIMMPSHDSPYFKELFFKVIDKAKQKKVKGCAYVLYEFLNHDAKENYEVIEMLDDKLEIIENKIVNTNPNDKSLISEILSVKKYMTRMNKRLWASSKLIFTIKKELTHIKLSREELALLDDIYDTLVHQIDLIETQKETITDFLEIFTSTISNRLALISNELNIVMKKMTALTIIIMIPTLIAGIYGTNFVNLPEVHWYFGYPFMWALMIAAAGITYATFHRKGYI